VLAALFVPNTLFPVLRIRDESQIPDPDFYPSQIPDLGSIHSNKRGVKTKFCHTFFCSHKFHKNENYFIFEVLKKMLANFQRIIEFLPKKLSLSFQKYGFEIQDSEKPISDHGSRGQKDTGSRIRIHNTACSGNCLDPPERQHSGAECHCLPQW
jgi:hypothetical protein